MRITNAHHSLNSSFFISPNILISNSYRFKNKTPSRYMRSGVFLPPYALPNLGLKATILNHKFFRTFGQNCEEHYDYNTFASNNRINRPNTSTCTFSGLSTNVWAIRVNRSFLSSAPFGRAYQQNNIQHICQIFFFVIIWPSKILIWWCFTRSWLNLKEIFDGKRD